MYYDNNEEVVVFKQQYTSYRYEANKDNKQIVVILNRYNSTTVKIFYFMHIFYESNKLL